MDRIALLTEVLSQNPSDAFARYGLAMEYSNSGDVERALEEFARLLATHPDYTAGYFMAAQTLAKAERIEEATENAGGRYRVCEENRQRPRPGRNGRHAGGIGVGNGVGRTLPSTHLTAVLIHSPGHSHHASFHQSPETTDRP